MFCVALIALSKRLNNTGYGYKIYDKTINHVFYIDDFKLFAKNDQKLLGFLKIVKKFGDHIWMKSVLAKCAKATFVHGKLVKDKIFTLDTTTVIKDLESKESYKYLSVTENN